MFIDITQIILLLIIAGLLISQRQGWSFGLGRKKLVLDSSGLIDGRILELAAAGFLPGELVIPRFILKELQLLADSKDSQRRERARFGLDVAKKLQDSGLYKVTINPYVRMHVKADDMLVELCKKIKADLYTIDFNLNKTATIEGVKILNVNELAHNLRPSLLPGERMQIKVMQKGSGKNQGVGYLDDGTMVVVENGLNLIGKQVEVEVERMHQTVAGKMVFARLVNHAV